MKPNLKSAYFAASLLSFATYVGILVFLRFYVIKAATTGLATSLIAPLTLASIAFVGLGCTCWYTSSHPQSTLLKRIVIFLLSPVALSPLIAVLYVTIVLLPIYGLAGEV